MSFKTQRRQISPEERLQNLINLKKQRQQAFQTRESVLENASIEASNKKEIEAIDKTLEDKESKNMMLDEAKNKQSKAKGISDKISLETRLFTEGKEMLFNKVLFELCLGGTYLDEDFKENKMSEMFDEFENTVSMVVGCCPETPVGEQSIIIKNIRELVTEACKTASKRITKKAMEDGNEFGAVNFDLDEEEQDKLNQDIKDLGAEELQELVKEKVLTVVKDERENNIKKQEMLDELDEKIKELTSDEEGEMGDEESDDTDEVTEEGCKKSVNEEDDFEDDDELLEAGCKKKTAAEEAACRKAAQEAGCTKKQKVVAESFEVKQLKAKRSRLNNTYGDTLFNSIMMEASVEIDKEITMENSQLQPSMEDVMNASLVTAIARYSVIETLNTLNMYEFNRNSVKALMENFVSKIK